LLFDLGEEGGRHNWRPFPSIWSIGHHLIDLIGYFVDWLAIAHQTQRFDFSLYFFDDG
jgi:hypothetical protein